MSSPSDNNPGLVISRNPLSYMGVNPYTPPDLLLKKFPPTPTDGRNCQLGTLWLNVGTAGLPTSEDIYMLVSKENNIFTWITLTNATGIQTLTGSTGGGKVFPDNTNNIDLTAGSGITITGDPLTNSLTFAATGATNPLLTLQGSTGGGKVSPDNTGNIALNAGTGLTITGNPGSHNLALVNTGVLTLIPSTGTTPVVPNAGAINITAGAGITTTGGANVITVANTGALTLTGTNNTVHVGPDNTGDIKFLVNAPSSTTGTQWISLVGNAGAHTLTLNAPLTFQGTDAISVYPSSAGDINIETDAPSSTAGTAWVTVTNAADHTLSINAPLSLTGTDAMAVQPDPTGNFVFLVDAPTSDPQPWVNIVKSGPNELTFSMPISIHTIFDLITTYPEAAGNFNFTATLGVRIVGIPGTSTIAWENTGVINLQGSTDGTTVNSSVLGTIYLQAGPNISITGNNLTSTITIGTTFSGAILTLTGNSGGAVSPTGGGNINIVGGTNINVVGTPGSNTLTINNTAAAGFTWTSTGASAVGMAVNNGYITTLAGLTTLTLPSVAAVGDVVELTGSTGNSWKVAQNAGQTIRYGNIVTTAGVGGSLASSDTGEGVRLVCIVANTSFQVLYSVGNLTYV